MDRFYVNSNMYDGHHEVHRTDARCPSHAMLISQVDLGSFSRCSDAILHANAMGYRPADGCAHCVPDCHTR